MVVRRHVVAVSSSGLLMPARKDSRKMPACQCLRWDEAMSGEVDSNLPAL